MLHQPQHPRPRLYRRLAVLVSALQVQQDNSGVWLAYQLLLAAYRCCSKYILSLPIADHVLLPFHAISMLAVTDHGHVHVSISIAWMLTLKVDLSRLVNAVGHDYGSAPAPRDEEEVSEVLADSETAPFSPNMLEQSITYASSPAADRDVSNEQQHPSSPAGPAGSRPARSAASPLLPRTSAREERQQSSQDLDLDPMASSIHAIHRQQDSPTSPFRQHQQRPQSSADNQDKDLDERVLSRAERRAVLADKLQEVFGLAEKEEVVAGASYPDWSPL